MESLSIQVIKAHLYKYNNQVRENTIKNVRMLKREEALKHFKEKFKTVKTIKNVLYFVPKDKDKLKNYNKNDWKELIKKKVKVEKTPEEKSEKSRMTKLKNLKKFIEKESIKVPLLNMKLKKKDTGFFNEYEKLKSHISEANANPVQLKKDIMKVVRKYNKI